MLLTFCTDNYILFVQTEREVNLMSPRTGRPLMDDSEKKNVRLDIRLTQEEKQFITDLSNRLNMNKSEMILKALHLLEEKQ